VAEVIGFTPPPKVWPLGGRVQTESVGTDVRRAALALRKMVRAPDPMVPSVSYIEMPSGTMNVEPRTRRKFTTPAVFQTILVPTPLAHPLPGAAAVMVTALPPLQAPTRCPLAESMISPPAGKSQDTEVLGKADWTEVKNV
jgi:hypothetical protein